MQVSERHGYDPNLPLVGTPLDETRKTQEPEGLMSKVISIITFPFRMIYSGFLWVARKVAELFGCNANKKEEPKKPETEEKPAIESKVITPDSQFEALYNQVQTGSEVQRLQALITMIDMRNQIPALQYESAMQRSLSKLKSVRCLLPDQTSLFQTIKQMVDFPQGGSLHIYENASHLRKGITSLLLLYPESRTDMIEKQLSHIRAGKADKKVLDFLLLVGKTYLEDTKANKPLLQKLWGKLSKKAQGEIKRELQFTNFTSYLGREFKQAAFCTCIEQKLTPRGT